MIRDTKTVPTDNRQMKHERVYQYALKSRQTDETRKGVPVCLEKAGKQMKGVN